jgi:hypothetical protein
MKGGNKVSVGAFVDFGFLAVQFDTKGLAKFFEAHDAPFDFF